VTTKLNDVHVLCMQPHFWKWLCVAMGIQIFKMNPISLAQRRFSYFPDHIMHGRMVIFPLFFLFYFPLFYFLFFISIDSKMHVRHAHVLQIFGKQKISFIKIPINNLLPCKQNILFIKHSSSMPRPRLLASRLSPPPMRVVLPCRWRTTDSGAKNNPLRYRTGFGSQRWTSTTRASSSLHALEHEPPSSPHETTSPTVSPIARGFLTKGPSSRQADMLYLPKAQGHIQTDTRTVHTTHRQESRL
jgi:hypothetical protein